MLLSRAQAIRRGNRAYVMYIQIYSGCFLSDVFQSFSFLAEFQLLLQIYSEIRDAAEAGQLDRQQAARNHLELSKYASLIRHSVLFFFAVNFIPHNSLHHFTLSEHLKCRRPTFWIVLKATRGDQNLHGNLWSRPLPSKSRRMVSAMDTHGQQAVDGASP